MAKAAAHPAAFSFAHKEMAASLRPFQNQDI